MQTQRAKKGSQRAAKKTRNVPQRPKKELPPRQSWVFVDATRDEDREERQVRALEFIAHFLDRIELQLERVADAIDLADVGSLRPET
jgi:hypothetical protein